MNDEFTRRVEDAINDLEALKVRFVKAKNFFETARINGKVEGLSTALEYYRRIQKDKQPGG